MNRETGHRGTPLALEPDSDAEQDSPRGATAFAVIQQLLVDARDRLDREVVRLTRMHDFNARALRLSRDAELTQAIAAAIVDIFAVEVGVCWLLDERGDIRAPIGARGLSADEAALREAGQRLLSASSLTAASRPPVLDDKVLADLAPALALGQAMQTCCVGADGRPLALLLGGHRQADMAALEEIGAECGGSFRLFAQQMGALIENRQGRALIERQLAEIRRSNEDLERERGMLRTLVRTLPDLVWLKSADGAYLDCNPRFESFFGAGRDEIVGKTDVDFVARDLADAFRENDRLAIAKGGPSINEEWIRFAADGHRELLETTKVPMVDSQGHLIGVLGIGHDITERKRVEEQLSLAVEITQLLFWELDFISGRLSYDKRLLPVLGLAPDEPLDTLSQWLASVHPDDREPFARQVERTALPDGPDFDFEYRLAGREGRYQWVHSKGRIVERASGGQPLRAVGTSANVTAHKTIEETLRASEEHAHDLATLLRLTCDNVPDMIWAKDLEGRYLFANKAMCEQLLLAKDSSEPVGKTDLFFAERERAKYPADAQWHTFGELCQDTDAVTLRRGTASVFEESGNVQGRHLCLEVHKAPFVNERGELIGTVGSARDINERKRIEAELEQHRLNLEELVQQRTTELVRTEARASHILQSSADGLYGVDRDGLVTFINTAACAMLGYTAEQVVGQSAHELFHHSRPDGTPYAAADCPSHRAVLAGQSVRIDNEVYWHADGHPLPVMYAVHPIVQAGVLAGAAISFVDMSEQRAAEQAREQALIAAENLARVRREFLANMSHEIRTPLNGVLGFAQIGYRNYQNSEKARNAFEKILTSGKMLLGVIDEVLDFSKIEAGKLGIERTVVRLPAVIEHALELIGERARAKGLELTVELAPDLPETCLGDPLRIGQVLLNLLANAVKFTETGGVTLSVARAADDLIFRVADTGIGIGPEQLHALFNPFQQADSSTTRRFGGTGLGLAISKRIVELMGGTIGVTSRPGVGSTFDFRIPYVAPGALATAADSKPRQESPARPLAGLSILVAEDNLINRMVLEENLREDGARVTLTGNGREAVAQVIANGRTAYDVVLMDVQMPEIDGLEATRRILELAPDLPIIGQTAHAFGEERDRCLAAGMVDHIAKPIDPDALVRLVLRYARPRQD